MLALRLLALALAASSIAFAGCAATSADEGEDAESSEANLGSVAWTPLLTCDGGAAVIDVNKNERRDFQLVVRDRNIVRHFASAFPGMSLANAKGEFIATSADHYHPGAFYKSDFRQFTQPGNAPTGYPVTIVERQGAGVRVSLVEGKIGNLAPFCNGQPLPHENEGFCAGTLEYRVYHAKADWFFRDCR
jgi:hypothetical protein